ncbi:hypothetical protein HU200_045720 [Digitaria exilis]|uniref:xylose isomerase n=1 Tax=Digitaria exilis TaxID=1010633 RepID=A0A835B059_9POAL|nr:hypothetical protein HU200_045720 [Digitaria exilis]
MKGSKLLCCTAGVISVPICRGESLLFYYFAYMLVVRVDNGRVSDFAPVLVLSDRCTETCPADLDSKCEGGASDDWEGEFFPGIPKIKYEVRVRPWKFRFFNQIVMWIKPFVLEQLIIVPQVRLTLNSWEKLGVTNACFHEQRIAAAMAKLSNGSSGVAMLDYYFTLQETNANLDEIVELAKQLQATFLQAAVDYKKKIGLMRISTPSAGLRSIDPYFLLAGMTGMLQLHSLFYQKYGLTGWDTDQFMTDIAEATLVMSSVVRMRRESTDVEDMFLAHISGMDTLARGLRNVDKLIEDGSLDELVRKRYQSFRQRDWCLIEVRHSTSWELDFLPSKGWIEPEGCNFLVDGAGRDAVPVCSVDARSIAPRNKKERATPDCAAVLATGKCSGSMP